MALAVVKPMEGILPKTYDSACYELAVHFLQDEDGLDSEEYYKQLAGEIQMCIEDEIHLMRLEAKKHA